MAEPTTPPKRKRHPAVVGRVMATGISTAALLGVVAGLAHDAAGGQGETVPIPEPSAPSTIVPVTPETVVVVREIHRTVYVDEHGNPVGPPTVAAAASAPASRSSRSLAAPATPPPQAAPAPPPPPPPAAKPSPPACSGSKCP